jgi:dipeptidyl aminopeptidase/acylaminoacyl peptidase
MARSWLLPLVALLFGAAVARAEPAPLIPRAVLFGNPERSRPQLSPDGKRLAWVQPDAHDVLQVWLRTLGRDDGKAITSSKRAIQKFSWSGDGASILYTQDADGDEDFHLFGVELATGNVRDFTPWQGVRAELIDPNPDFPGTVLCLLNLRDRKLTDVYRIDLRSGAAELDTKNPGDVVEWVADSHLQIRAVAAQLADGGSELRVRADAQSPWKTLVRAGREDELWPFDVTGDGKAVLALSSVGADTVRLVEYAIASGEARELARNPEVDAGDPLVDPVRHVVQAVPFDKGRRTWTVLDPSVKADLAAIARLTDGDFDLMSRDRADRTWLVRFNQDRGPVRFYTFDRATKKGTFLFSHQPKLEGLRLAEMKAVVIPARDGLPLNAYLSLPPGSTWPASLPLVLLVHGGPWARDHWGYQSQVQWLANRGYAVLQVNYRGSSGFGKKFLHAGDREWGKKMQDDLTDAALWAVKMGIADRERLAIFGGSYGGYAALMGAVATPRLYRCAVDIVGPTNLVSFIRAIPPYWAPLRAMFATRVGNIDDPKDTPLLERASPLEGAARIRIPLLIGQGANDPRVKQTESEQLVEAIARRGGQAIYVLYPDEGHGFIRPENRIDFFARAEQFLAQHLGGRAEPIAGERQPGSSAVVRVLGKR